MNQVAQLQSSVAAPAVGTVFATDAKEHTFHVTVWGTGAISVTVNPRWGAVSGNDGDKLTGAGSQVLTGTDSISWTFTRKCATSFVQCPVEAISGTGAKCSVDYVGAR